jgi:hypothetical protein
MTAPSRNAWSYGSNGGCNHRGSFWARDRETSTNPSSRLLKAAPDQIRSIPQGHGLDKAVARGGSTGFVDAGRGRSTGHAFQSAVSRDS